MSIVENVRERDEQPEHGNVVQSLAVSPELGVGVREERPERDRDRHSDDRPPQPPHLLGERASYWWCEEKPDTRADEYPFRM